MVADTFPLNEKGYSLNPRIVPTGFWGLLREVVWPKRAILREEGRAKVAEYEAWWQSCLDDSRNGKILIGFATEEQGDDFLETCDYAKELLSDPDDTWNDALYIIDCNKTKLEWWIKWDQLYWPAVRRIQVVLGTPPIKPRFMGYFTEKGLDFSGPVNYQSFRDLGALGAHEVPEAPHSACPKAWAFFLTRSWTEIHELIITDDPERKEAQDNLRILLTYIGDHIDVRVREIQTKIAVYAGTSHLRRE